MENWNVHFQIAATPVQFRYEAAGDTVWEASLEHGILRVSMGFTADPHPLTLTAEAKPGDEACFVYRPYRIELYVNDILADEEWPSATTALPTPG